MTLQLQSLRIEQFRRFRQPLEIDGLKPGINLFTGPNESGKSTVVKAIRAAFFERHKSSTVEDLRPWGDSAAAPTVQLDFTWQGELWQLRKSFLRHKRCDLQVGAQAIQGDEAEERLAQLLGYQLPGRGASKAEHWGIPGLLWIEQGAGQEIHAAVGHAGEHLQSALGESLGEVASSTGDALINQVQAERAKLLTATGRPTGIYAKLIEQQAELQSSLDALDLRIAQYRQQVDRLGELRQQQREDAERPWDSYRQQVAQVRAQLAEVEVWVQTQQQERQELGHIQSSLQLCLEQLHGFARQQTQLEQRAQARAQATSRLAEIQARQLAVDGRLVQARQDHQQARSVLLQAREADRSQTIMRDMTRLDQEISVLSGQLQNAEMQQNQLHDLRRQLQMVVVDAKLLAQLQDLYRERSELQIQQQAVATRLQFELQDGQTFSLDGEAMHGAGECLLLEPATLDIAGIGRLRIMPGGEDVAALQRRQQAVRDRITDLQSKMQVMDLAEAQQRSQQGMALLQDIRHVEQTLNHLAPEGLPALHAHLEVIRQEQQSLQARLEAQPPLLPEGALPIPNVMDAEARLESVSEQLRIAEQAQAEFRQAIGLAEQAVRNTETEWNRLREETSSEQRQQREVQLNHQLLELRAKEEKLQKSMVVLQQQIESARPDILRQDIERLSRTADGLEQMAQQRNHELTRLLSSLEAQGAQGLEEQRDELALQWQAVERRRDEFARRAQALDLLLELLGRKRQELTRRLQAPLQRHLNRYLQLLHAQATLQVDENLMPTALVRTEGGQQQRGDFAELSFGAREQMGLISRLAYADLLQEAGRPTLIILDDALVHSDRQRLAQMKRVLFDAAQRHQILLFTCHPDNWRDLGVMARDLPGLQALSGV